MRILTWLILGGALCGCSYDFDADTDLFACDSDSDCTEGHACGRQLAVDGDVVTVCVIESQVELGVYLHSGSPLSPADQANSSCQYAYLNVLAWAEFSTSAEPASVAGDFNPPSDVDTSLCRGTVSAKGAVDVLCTSPVSALEGVQGASVWAVVFNDTNNSGSRDSGEDWATLFARGDLDPDNRLAYFSVSKFDQELASSQRDACQRALARSCTLDSEIDYCSDCSAYEGMCPYGFSCVSGACVSDVP